MNEQARWWIVLGCGLILASLGVMLGLPERGLVLAGVAAVVVGMWWEWLA